MKYIFILFAILTFFFVIPKVFAAQTISVSPSVVRLDLSVDKPEAQIFYTNNSNETIELSFEAQDFTSLEDGYKLSFLNPKEANNYQYKLSSWVEFSTNSLVLSPGEKEPITVSINTDKLTPGGHYTSILAHVVSKDTSNDKVSLQSTLASLLFVRTNTGKETEEASLENFEISKNSIFYPFPKSADFSFNNSGDTDLTPYGIITIKSSSGTIAKGIINEDSFVVLPESIRQFEVPVRLLQTFILPGWYSAELNIHYGKSKKEIHLSKSFFTEGSIPIGEILITGFILLGLIYFVAKRFFRKKTS